VCDLRLCGDQLSGVEIVVINNEVWYCMGLTGSSLIGAKSLEDLGRLRRVLFDVQAWSHLSVH
jgi:hypothetical protein